MFYRCGRPAARTGRVRAVCHGRPGARPLTANYVWHHGSPARRRPRRSGLPGLGKVEVIGPGVTIVDDEFYFTPDPIATPLVLSAVVDVFTSDVPQDDRPLKDLFQFSHVVNSCTTFVYSLLPPLYFLPSCGCNSLASQDALEVFHNPLCHAVEVAVSQRSKVGRVRASDGVEAVGNCGDRVGMLVDHAVNSGQHTRLCVPRDLDDPLALLSLSPDWIKLVFKDPIIIVLTEKLESQNKIALWESCKKLGGPDVGHPSV